MTTLVVDSDGFAYDENGVGRQVVQWVNATDTGLYKCSVEILGITDILPPLHYDVDSVVVTPKTAKLLN